jgi:2-dehydropantoate 2-reductase
VRYIVYGAGGIGSVVGGRLFEHGHDVVLIARPAHAEAIAAGGLRIESADGTVAVPVPVVTQPSELTITVTDVVMLAMKSQGTVDAVRTLAGLAPSETPVVSLQNGVANEAIALRRFANVYGICVMCPASYLEPGVVQAFASPTSGVLDIGRFPEGLDDVAVEVAASLASATFSSRAVPDIMRWKYTKLLMNLGNSIQAVGAPGEWLGQVWKQSQEEGEACLRAAGIPFASWEEDRERRGDLTRSREIPGRDRGGGSSWQSLARGTGDIEADYLNGEIVLLGRLHGVGTPVNSLLQRLANDAARRQDPPGQVTQEQFTRMLEEEHR